ncbi:unnamed protein product [Urochloa humidicola]
MAAAWVEAAMAEKAAVEMDRKKEMKVPRRKTRCRRRRKSHMVVEGRIRDCDPKQEADCSPPSSEWADLEPFFFDEAAPVADHERRTRIEEAEAVLYRREKAALDRIREQDPKDGSTYYSRIYFVDLRTFDLDEESPLGPMRETDASIDVCGTVCKEGRKQLLPDDCANILASDGGKQFITSDSTNLLSVKVASKDRPRKFVPCHSANVLSVKIVSSDVGFPIDVYGTVIARDSLDLKCVYLFYRDRDHSQLILSKDESLILTGPKRGLALMDDIYFEMDLKIKGGQRRKDKQLSKGYLELDGIPLRLEDEMVVERNTLDTKLSKVMVTYAVVKYAVEATFAIEVLKGRFYGEITACTTSIRDSIVLYDSKVAEPVTGNGKGVIHMLRNVVAVCLKEKLIMTVTTRTGDGKPKSTTIKFTPGVNGGGEKEITCGSIKMCVKVTWSIISRNYFYPKAMM